MEYVLVAVVLLLAYQLLRPRSFFREIYADIRRRRRSAEESAEQLARLHRLTPQERDVLRVYVQQPLYERVQDPADTVVRQLIERGILRPVPEHRQTEASTFSIAAWTRSYLSTRPELLS